MLVKCCFCLQCMTIQSEINDCLKHCFKFVLEVNSFSKPVYMKICLRLNPIFTEMVYKINKTKCTVDTKSSKIRNSTFI